MQPIIGIVPSMSSDEKSYNLHSDNVEAVKKAGGLSLIIPFTEDEKQRKQTLQLIDGLYLTGGVDVEPKWYDEEPHPKLGKVDPGRDQFEIALVKEALALNIPFFGVCRGSQALNVALGGNMFQDIYAQNDRELLQHQQKSMAAYTSHTVQVESETLLYQLTGKTRLHVNSRHHQANRYLGENLQVSATAGDGIIEAIEGTTDTFVLGVQWHPESLLSKDDEDSLKIYEGFIEASRQYKDNR